MSDQTLGSHFGLLSIKILVDDREIRQKEPGLLTPWNATPWGDYLAQKKEMSPGCCSPVD